MIDNLSLESSTPVADPDTDDDGVDNDADKCEGGKATDEFPQYGDKKAKNRFMWNGSNWETNAKPGTMGGFAPESLEDTLGCTGEQILDAISAATGLDFGGEYKFGITKGTIEAWLSGEYNLGPAVLETVEVSGESDATSMSVMSLQDGVDYTLNAHGTYRFANWGEYGIADAEWAYRDAVHTPDNIAGWVKGEGYYVSECGLDIQVDGSCVDWGDLSVTNEYSLPYVGTGAPIEFSIYDNSYGDNEGSLFVDIVGDEIVQLWP